ncbi:calcium-binding protein [Sulfurimonas sp.]|uniref:calcium-binding protein n=1 Tax=Sulfurimonas sp. TaxID=2022749 RepID=UPI003458AEFF
MTIVTISRDQSNLYFTINGTEDKITVASYFDAPEYHIEQVTFTDGTLWNSAMFNQIL